jgi:hypothetical protein
MARSWTTNPPLPSSLHLAPLVNPPPEKPMTVRGKALCNTQPPRLAGDQWVAARNPPRL